MTRTAPLLLLWGLVLAGGAAAAPPQRIVSLVPNITEELYLLGAGDRLVGVTTYCRRPPEVQRKEKVGTVIEVNVEKIVQLSPDLVIASPLADHRQVNKLRNLGLLVQVFPPPRDFVELCDSFIQLAKLVGKGAKGEQIVQEAQEEMAVIRDRARGLPRPRVFVQIGERPLVTAGGDSFIDDAVAAAGGENICHHLRTGVVSREEVVKQDPDIILILQMGVSGKKEREAWMRYKTIKAVKAGRVYLVNPTRLCSPTPLSFIEEVRVLMRLFHGI